MTCSFSSDSGFIAFFQPGRSAMHGILQGKGRIKGFTLLEILIAVFLFGIILSTIFVSYTGTFRIIEDTGSQVDVYAMARTAMERMLEDLGSVYVPEMESDIAEVDMSFTGSEKEIDGVGFASLRFISTAHLDFDQDHILPEPAEIVYVVRETGAENVLALYRSDTPTHQPIPDDGSGGLLLCDGLSGFKCTYYDAGGVEHVSWGGADAPSKEIIPAMVTIYLEFTNASNPEAPLKFRSAVALPPVGNRDESTS